MNIGTKIKIYRIDSGLTQKDLADRLHLTVMTIYGWENGETEPSIENLTEMAKVFNVTIDELLGVEKETVKEEPEKKEEIQPVKPVLALCENCNKPLFDSSEIFRYSSVVNHRTGRTSHSETIPHILCESCNNLRIEKEKEEERQRKFAHDAACRNRKIHSFVWASLVALVFIIIGIVYFIKSNVPVGVVCLVLAVFGYCFTATMILNNTFIPDMWLEITSWGFVKLPGIIFEFSMDGFIFLIVMKILFAILGFLLALSAAVLATILSMVLCIFVYPFALLKNIRCED